MGTHSALAFMDVPRLESQEAIGSYRGGCVEMVTGTAGVTPDSTTEAVWI